MQVPLSLRQRAPDRGNIHSLTLPPWLEGVAPSEPEYKAWKKQRDWDLKFRDRNSALQVGVTPGKKAGASWLPDFGSTWGTGSRGKQKASFIEDLRKGGGVRRREGVEGGGGVDAAGDRALVPYRSRKRVGPHDSDDED